MLSKNSETQNGFLRKEEEFRKKLEKELEDLTIRKNKEFSYLIDNLKGIILSFILKKYCIFNIL